MDKPLVSIIIPTYGRNNSLKKAIESAENQTYKNIEVIVVDDNNPNTEQRKINENLMLMLKNKYNNIKYIKHKKNKNGAAARNTGIKKSSGDYIAFLDDDDIFYENKIEKQLKYLKNNLKYKCVGCGYKQGNKIIKNTSYGNVTKEILTLKYCFTTSILFFDKKALISIGGFDERFIRHQDYELLLKYCKKYEIGKMEEVLLIKGMNSGENIPTGKKAEKNKILFLKTFSDLINSINEHDKHFKKTVLYENYYQLFKDELRGKHYLLAAKYGCISIMESPINFIKDAKRTFARMKK